MVRPNYLRISRGVAFACGGVVAVLVLAAALAILLFDADAVKSEAARIMLAQKQRSLRLDGDLSLSFWPGLGLRLSNASLSEKNSEQVFAAVTGARLSLKLLPLLHKELVVDTVELEGLSASLVRHKDGSFNFDDLLSQDKDKPPLRFDVAGVNLKHGHVTWVDEAPGRRAEVTELDLSSGRLANVAQGKLTVAGRLAVDKPALASKVHLEGRYRYDLDKKTYALDGLDIRASGDLAGLSGAETALDIDVLSVAPAGLDASKFELAIKGKSGDQGVELKASLPHVRLGGDRASVETGSVTVAVSRPLQHGLATFKLTSLEKDGRVLKAAKLALNADVRVGADTYLASLASPLVADLDSQSLNLPELGGEAELGHAALAVKRIVLPIKGSLQADFSKSSLNTALDTRLDDGKVAARLNLSRFSPPAIGFALDIERLNVDKYLPPSITPARASPATPLDFSFLNGLDLTGALKIGFLQLSGVKTSNLRLDVKTKDGKLETLQTAPNK